MGYYVWAGGGTEPLLERRTVNPDKPDRYFRQTALSWAAGENMREL